MVGALVISEGQHIVLVDVPTSLPMSGGLSHRFKMNKGTLLINVRACSYAVLQSKYPIWHDEYGSVFVCADRDLNKPFMQVIAKLGASEGLNYHIHRWTDIPSIDSFTVGNQSILFKANNSYYRSTIDSTISPAIEITLEPAKRKLAEVEEGHITRGSLRRAKEVTIQIETYGNLFERLCALAEMFGTDTKLAFRYTHRGSGVSYGGGIRRVFVQDALSQFEEAYLLRHGAGSEFNLTALLALPPPKLFIIGRALHLAMHINRTCLSVRLPIPLMVALIGREPSIDELEFFLQQESPELYDIITSYYDDPEGLEECGYVSYREVLNHRVYYECSDPEVNNQIRRVSQYIAQGFTSYAPIINIRSMNMPTLDYYLSGPYCINRKLLISMIRCGGSSSNCNALVKFIKGLIERLPEDRLAVFLRNWTGTTVVKNARCMIDTCSGIDINFATCTRTLSMNPSLVHKSNSQALPSIIEMLTTPISTARG